MSYIYDMKKSYYSKNQILIELCMLTSMGCRTHDIDYQHYKLYKFKELKKMCNIKNVKM